LSREQANDALLEEILSENMNSRWEWEDGFDNLWDDDYEDWTGYASD